MDTTDITSILAAQIQPLRSAKNNSIQHELRDLIDAAPGAFHPEILHFVGAIINSIAKLKQSRGYPPWGAYIGDEKDYIISKE